jgi:hypothetical protein
MERFEGRIASSGSATLKKGGVDKQTMIGEMSYTATAQSVITFTSTTNNGNAKVITVDAAPGSNWLCESFTFPPGEDITIAVTGGSVSLFFNYNYK